MIGDRTRTTVIAVVTSVWAINFGAGLIPALNYKPDQAINGIFMAIVGGLFAIGARGKNDAAAKAAPPPAKKLQKAPPSEGSDPT